MKKHMPMNAATVATATANVLHRTRQLKKMKKHMPMNAATFETATANVLHTTRQPKKMKENMPINATAVALRPKTSYMQRAVQQKRRAWANEHGNRRICDRNRIT